MENATYPDPRIVAGDIRDNIRSAEKRVGLVKDLLQLENSGQHKFSQDRLLFEVVKIMDDLRAGVDKLTNEAVRLEGEMVAIITKKAQRLGLTLNEAREVLKEESK